MEPQDSKNADKIKLLKEWARRHGWSDDRYGNMKKTRAEDNQEFRLKFNATSLRYEARVSTGWVCLRSGYYKDLSINDKDHLAGLTRNS